MALTNTPVKVFAQMIRSINFHHVMAQTPHPVASTNLTLRNAVNFWLVVEGRDSVFIETVEN
jgi:hypothetical protein